jgi:hypothetical protein
MISPILAMLRSSMNNRVAHRRKQPTNKRQTPAQGMRVKLPPQFKRVKFQVKPQARVKRVNHEDASSIQTLQSSDMPPSTRQDAFSYFGPMYCAYSTESMSFDKDALCWKRAQLDTNDWTTWMAGMIKAH